MAAFAALGLLSLVIATSIAIGSGEQTMASSVLSYLTSRTTCLAICYLDKGTVTSFNECQQPSLTFAQSIQQETERILKDVSSSTNPSAGYIAIYNRFMKSRSFLCNELAPIFSCAKASTLYKLCGHLGEEYTDDMIALVKSRRALDCGNPSSFNMVACGGHPDFIFDIILKGESHQCITLFTKSALYPKLTGDTLGGLKNILANPNDKRDLCSLLKEIITCFRNTMKTKAGCPDQTLTELEEEMDTLLEHMGCGKNPDYNDIPNCVLTLLEGPGAAAVGSCFQSISLSPTITSNGLFKLDKGLCPLVSSLNCVLREMKTRCGEKATWTRSENIVSPLLDYLVLVVGCSGTSKGSVGDCKCLSSDYPYGGTPDAATCKVSAKFHSSAVQPKSTVTATSLMLMIPLFLHGRV